MNKFDEKIINWSEQQFSIKLNDKQSLNFLRTKKGPTFQKLLSFMSNRIKSKKEGTKIKRFCESIKLNNELKTIENEMKEIESNVRQIRIELIEEQMKQKKIAIKEEISNKQMYVLSILINIIYKIANKNKMSTHFILNSKPINQTVYCYEKLFTPFLELSSEHNSSSVETTHLNNNFNSYQLIVEINELIESINNVLFVINEFDVNQQIYVNFDIEMLSKSLMETKPIVKFINKEESKLGKDLKKNKITLKLTEILDLIEKYEKIREEKMAKSKDKLEKVILSCDSFIQQRRRKC